MNPEQAGTGGAAAANGLTLERARALARDVGFDEAGLVALPHGDEARDAARFEEWIAAGRAGTMDYLKRASDEGALLRARIHAPFPWARSAIACFAVYNAAQPRSIDPAPREAGWIARYAWSSRVDERGDAAAVGLSQSVAKASAGDGGAAAR